DRDRRAGAATSGPGGGRGDRFRADAGPGRAPGSHRTVFPTRAAGNGPANAAAAGGIARPSSAESPTMRSCGQSLLSATVCYLGSMTHPGRPDDDQDERDRRNANIFLLVFGAIVIGLGIWLVNTMVDQKKLDDCLSQGRRNCNPIEAPAR